MGKHSKPQDREPVKPSDLPTYPCQHTGRVIVNGRIQCTCGKDYGPYNIEDR